MSVASLKEKYKEHLNATKKAVVENKIISIPVLDPVHKTIVKRNYVEVPSIAPVLDTIEMNAVLNDNKDFSTKDI